MRAHLVVIFALLLGIAARADVVCDYEEVQALHVVDPQVGTTFIVAGPIVFQRSGTMIANPDVAPTGAELLWITKDSVGDPVTFLLRFERLPNIFSLRLFSVTGAAGTIDASGLLGLLATIDLTTFDPGVNFGRRARCRGSAAVIVP